MIQAATIAATPQNKDRVGKLLKWAFWLILIVVLLVLIYFASLLAEYGATLNPATWAEATQNYFEAKTGLTDTGAGSGGAFLSAIYWGSFFGIGGGFLGIGTSSSGWAGAREASNNSASSTYTFFMRLLGR